MKRVILILLIISSFGTVKSQSFFEFNNRHLSQSQLWNPGFMPQYKATLSFGQTSFGANFVGSTLNGLFGSNETPIQTVKRLIIEEEKQLGIDVDQQTDLFHFGFRSKKSYFALNSNIVNEASVRIPKDLFGLAFLGNGAFIEKDADIDFSGNRFRSYLKNTFTYGRFITNELSVGVNASLINGITDFGLDRAQFQIGTDTGTASIYSMTLIGALKGRASLLGVDVEEALNDSSFDVNQILENQLQQISLNTNQGYAFGFGAVYRMSEQFRFSFAVQNIGSITWNLGAQEINLNESTWQWNGLDTNQIDQISGDVATQLQDTFLNKFDVSSGRINQYTTALKPRYTLGAEFLLFPRTHLQAFGGYGFGINGDKSFVGANLHQEIGEWIDLRIGYSYYDFNNPNHRLGLGLSLNLGPLQVFGSFNDILGVVQYGSATVTSGTVGININIGRRKDRDYDEVPDKRDSCYKTFGVISNDGCPYGFLGGSMNYDDNETSETEEATEEAVEETQPQAFEKNQAPLAPKTTSEEAAMDTPTEAAKSKSDEGNPKTISTEVVNIENKYPESEVGVPVADTLPTIENNSMATKEQASEIISEATDSDSIPTPSISDSDQKAQIDSVTTNENKEIPKKTQKGKTSKTAKTSTKKSTIKNAELESLMLR